MFHSAGYFRAIRCPFFEHGLCHRPHCHYKHAEATKSELQSSKRVRVEPPQLTLSLASLQQFNIGLDIS